MKKKDEKLLPYQKKVVTCAVQNLHAIYAQVGTSFKQLIINQSFTIGESCPESKPATKPAAKPEAKPEQKPAAKPAPKPVPKPAPKPKLPDYEPGSEGDDPLLD